MSTSTVYWRKVNNYNKKAPNQQLIRGFFVFMAQTGFKPVTFGL